MILENVSNQGRMNLGGISRTLKPLWIVAKINTKSKFNLEEGKKKEIQGNLIEAKLVFDIIGLMNQGLQNKINKLIGDECYTSDKLQSL